MKPMSRIMEESPTEDPSPDAVASIMHNLDDDVEAEADGAMSSQAEVAAAEAASKEAFAKWKKQNDEAIEKALFQGCGDNLGHMFCLLNQKQENLNEYVDHVAEEKMKPDQNPPTL
jgi:post-segregation antitoxin (ccd killing protein)